MAKYKLVNEYGNAVYKVDSESEKESLLKRGFKLCKSEKSEKCTTEKKGKGKK